MGKFCINCGKQLDEGQACDCKADIASVEEKPENVSQEVKNAKNFIEFLKDMFKFSINFLKHPADLTKLTAQKEDYKTGLFFVILQALIIAVFMLVLVRQSVDTTYNALGSLGGLLGLIGFSENDVPYFSIFLKTFLIISAQFFLLAGIFFGLSKLIFKGAGSFKAVMGAMGVAAIPLSAVFLASVILMFLFPKSIVYLVSLGSIISILLNYIGIKEALKVTENKCIYLIPTAYIIYLFAIVTFMIETAKSTARGLL